MVAVSKGVAGSVRRHLGVDDESDSHNLQPDPTQGDSRPSAASACLIRGSRKRRAAGASERGERKQRQRLPHARQSFWTASSSSCEHGWSSWGVSRSPYKQELVLRRREAHGVDEDSGFCRFSTKTRTVTCVGRRCLPRLPTGKGCRLCCWKRMACGTPVVSTDARYGPSEILDGGRWGKLVPVRDASALAQAMVEAPRRATGLLKRRSWAVLLSSPASGLPTRMSVYSRRL